MARQDEELKSFEGIQIKQIRRATDEEYEKVSEVCEVEELMVAELQNGCKLYLLTDIEVNLQDDEDKETVEVAIAENNKGEIIEIPAE